MNLGDIELSIYDQLNLQSNPDSGVIRRIRRHINLSHRQVLAKRGFGVLRNRVLTATAVANSPFLVLPQAATKVSIISDRARNFPLDKVSIADIRYRDPGLNMGNIADSYALINVASCTAVDPSTADSLFVVSDSALDGSGMSVNIEGVITGGYPRRASVALNGLTAVNVDSAIASWILVTKFYISGLAAGNVTLHQTTGAGTELARITKGRAYPRYTLLHLSPTPSSADVYYCDVDLHVDDMVNPTDEPLFPEDFHQLLIFGALKREYLKREKMAEYAEERRNWNDMVGDLGAFLRSSGGVGKSGQRGDTGGRRRQQFNNSTTAGVIW